MAQMSIWGSGPFSWLQPCPSCHAILARWTTSKAQRSWRSCRHLAKMDVDHRSTETGPWSWKQDSFVINLNDPFNGEVGEVFAFSAVRVETWPVLINFFTARDMKPLLSNMRLLLNSSMLIGKGSRFSQIATQFMGQPCPLCGGPGHWEHLAWECASSPLAQDY